MICLREKGVLLRDSYYLEAEYTENLSEEQRQFLAMVQEYKECHPVFSAEKIGAIFEAARRLGIPRKGNLSQKECYYIKEIEQSLVCEKEEYFLKRKLKGVPESIQEQIQGVVGNPCLIRKDGTKHYLFFAPEIAALWNKGHDIPLKLTDIPAMCESLVHKQYYDRELFAESIWKFARPLYVIKAGIEEEKNRFLPKFFFVPLTKAHQDKLSVSCEKYQEILEKYMGSVLNFETGICLTNFQEAFQFIGEVRKNRSLDKRDLSEEATKNLRHFFSVLQNQGWHCELKIMRSLEKRISFVLKHKHEEDTLLILTDPQRVSVWGKFFPEALIYTQRKSGERI